MTQTLLVRVMTVSSDNRQAGPFTGNDVTDTFPFEFKVFAAADVLVVHADADGVETEWTLDDEYSVMLNADQEANPGGDVVSADPLPDGEKIAITSRVAETQGVDLTNLGGFYPKVIATALDRLTILVQQLSNTVRRIATFPITSEVENVTLPPLADGEGWVWDDDVGGLVAAPINTDAVAAAVVAAEAAADAAAASAAAIGTYPSPFTAYTVLGRASGSGDPALLPFTAAGQAVAGAATAADQRMAMGAAASGSVASSGLTLATSKILGRVTASTGAVEELSPAGGIALASGAIYVGGDYARPPVRQTVLSSSVDSNGYPNFITDPNNGLEVAIAATTTPVVLTAAGGAGVYGAKDRIGAITADTTISGLTDNTTNYLYADIAADGSVTLGKTTLFPYYWHGGSYPTTNNLFTFHTQAMVGKVGNGTTADQVYRVFIGEAVTSGGQVTSVVNYALMGRYQSADTSVLAASSLYSFSHNIGVRDVGVSTMLRCVTGEHGYANGDIADLFTYTSSGDSYRPLVFRASRNSCGFYSGDGGVTNALVVINAGTGATAYPTSGNWSVFIRAERGW